MFTIISPHPFLKGTNKRFMATHWLIQGEYILKIVYRYGKCNVWNVFATENFR